VAEAVAEAVVAGTVRSGAGTVFSTVTVRADGTGGAACSRLLLIRPRRNPKSSATANTTSTNATNLASPGFLLPWMTLLLPILLSLRSSSRTHTRSAGEVGPTAQYSHELTEGVRRHQRGSEEGRHPAPRTPPHPASGALGSDDHAHPTCTGPRVAATAEFTLHKITAVRTSWNAVNAKFNFGEFPFHALG
jgi:hypothetical protein